MHAKCVIVDGRWTLITSANFTTRGHNRNIEAGVLIDSPSFATKFRRHWSRLVDEGVMQQIR